MNTITAASLNQYIARARTVLDSTGILNPEFDALTAKWDVYRDNTVTASDLLATAILEGAKPERIAELHALALAENTATPVEQASVHNAAADRIYTEAHNAYRAHAQEVWEAAATLWDATGAKFAKAADVVDPETNAAVIVKADSKTRTAWMDAQHAAATLDQIQSLILDAAQLSGWTTGGADRTIPLLCDPADHHRRRVYEAWETTKGNTRRWGALHKLGVQITAPDSIDDVKPYREPRAMQIKQVKQGYGIRQIQVDPEDPQPELTGKTGPRVFFN